MRNDEQTIDQQQQGLQHGTPAGNSEGSSSSQQTDKSTSSRRVEANRRNASRSTGPKTILGKKTVAKNAIKHGFFAKFLLIPHADGKENQHEYDAFYADAHKHYQPLGWLEELWLEKITVWAWRLRRLIRCESGQIARALATHSDELQQSKTDHLAEPESAPSSNAETEGLTDHLFLPEKEELDRLLRYEAMINRQLNHAIGELERVQERRKGESNTTSA